MKEYIERERLKEAFNADLQTLQSLDEHTMNLILIEIDEAPAADVAPVRHGHWNDINPAVLKPGVNWVCRCSECGCPQDYKHNYCPSCGARMDEKEGKHEAD